MLRELESGLESTVSDWVQFARGLWLFSNLLDFCTFSILNESVSGTFNDGEHWNSVAISPTAIKNTLHNSRYFYHQFWSNYGVSKFARHNKCLIYTYRTQYCRHEQEELTRWILSVGISRNDAIFILPAVLGWWQYRLLSIFCCPQLIRPWVIYSSQSNKRIAHLVDRSQGCTVTAQPQTVSQL